MDAEELTDEALMHKKKKTESVARKMDQKQQDEEDTDRPTGRQVEQGNNDENDNWKKEVSEP